MYAAPIRAVMGAPVTLTFTSHDSNGEPSTDDPGVVTVDVTGADGTAIETADATTGTGASRSYTLSATHTALLDRLTVAWTVSGATVQTNTVDVVGGTYVSLAAIRAGAPSLAVVEAHDDAELLQARAGVEALFERATGHVLSFVPRFDTATMYHRGQRMLRLPHYFLRRVRWARYWYDDATATDVTPSLLTAIQPNAAGLAILYDDTESWPTGRLVVGYEHGMDAPPPDVVKQAIAAVRRQVFQQKSSVDSRAISFTTATGEVQRFPTPGLGPWVTGVPEIDELLQSYRESYPMSQVG